MSTVVDHDQTQDAVIGVLPALRRLDDRLTQAVARAREVFGTETPDRFRGLYLDEATIGQHLARGPGETRFTRLDTEPIVLQPPVSPQFAWLAQTYELTPFDLDVLLIALAPEIDLRYESLYAFLQDDVTRKRPSVDLILHLLSASLLDRVEQRGRFGAEAPLIWHQLIHLNAEDAPGHPPLLAQSVRVDAQIVQLLVRDTSLDFRLAACCESVNWSADHQRGPLTRIPAPLISLVRDARVRRCELRLYFQGSAGAGKRTAVVDLAAELGLHVLIVDAARALDLPGDAERLFRLAVREAWIRDALLYIDGTDPLWVERCAGTGRRVAEVLSHFPGVLVLAGTQPWAPCPHGLTGVLTIPFPPLTNAEARVCWHDTLVRRAVQSDPAEGDLEALAGGFSFTPGQIVDTVATAAKTAQLRGAAEPSLGDLQAAARAQSGATLAGLARKIEPAHGWADMVLPAETMTELHEICAQVAHRQRVLHDWGFGRRLVHGSATTVLFVGPSGTGKTMAAEVLAAELGLGLYKIDLAGVVSKYIGETEKNLDRIFNAADDSNAILFFDEAEALFGKRSEVSDAHDRYANIEIAFLLQKMEQYEGIAILTTNLRQNMDEAFIRRLQHIVEFPFPDVESRQQIWRVLLPEDAPRDAAIDFDLLAHSVPLAGGSIRNVVLGAAYLAAANGSQIDMGHLLQAARREYRKMGKLFSTSELEGLTSIAAD